MRPLQHSLLLVFVLWGTCAAAQVQPYDAKVYTNTGKVQGLLERVNDKFICVATYKDYWAIPVADVKKIALKKSKGTYGSIVSRSAATGANTFVGFYSDNQARQFSDPNQTDDTPLLSYVAAGAVLGTVKGLVQGIRKNTTFKINNDTLKFKSLKDDLKRYARYNQIVPDFSVQD